MEPARLEPRSEDSHAAERGRLFEELWALEDAGTGGPWDAVLADLHTRIEQRLDVIGRD